MSNTIEGRAFLKYCPYLRNPQKNWSVRTRAPPRLASLRWRPDWMIVLDSRPLAAEAVCLDSKPCGLRWTGATICCPSGSGGSSSHVDSPPFLGNSGRL